MNCKTCGREGRADALFCFHCGAAASKAHSPDLLDRGGMEIGPYCLIPHGDEEFEGLTPKKQEAAATARTWQLIGPPGVDLILADISWTNGERCVMALRRGATQAPRYDVLVGRLRLPYQKLKDGTFLAYLKQARRNAKPRPTLCKATLVQLSEGSGLPVSTLLLDRFGVRDIGTVSEIAPELQRRSPFLAARFDRRSNAHLAAYVLTRVAPVVRDYDGFPPSNWLARGA